MLDYIDANLADQESRDIIHNRCKTFLTGDLSYIDKMKSIVIAIFTGLLSNLI